MGTILTLQPLGTALGLAADATPPPGEPTDNIYHELDNLPDDADVFPRMGKIAGPASERTNCRVAPWGRVVTRFLGGSFIEINRRQVDSRGESWFYNNNLRCWVHDSRIDLL